MDQMGNGVYEPDPEPWIAEGDGPFVSPGDQTPPDFENEFVSEGRPPDPPPVPGGSDTPGQGVTAVNTEAMATFARNMESLAETLKPLPNQLEEVNVKPGYFATANTRIAQPIVGPNGLRDSTRTTLQDLTRALYDVSDSVNRASKDYENADEANNMTADQYNQYFNTVNGAITSAGQTPS